MKSTYKAEKINVQDFQTLLARYDGHVPSKLKDLDQKRLDVLPARLVRRRKDGSAYLEKGEVEDLVEWKLKHGTYRPNLAKLVASNSDDGIIETTKSGFSTYAESDPPDPSKALRVLTKLKGVGPATASLLLSTYDPVNVPFFSDELFRWLNWSEKKNGGWNLKIGYTAKEYKTLCEKVIKLQDRFLKPGADKVRAIDIEKVAYVLHKEDVKTEEDAANETHLPPSKKRKANDNDNDHSEESPSMKNFWKDYDRQQQVLRNGPNGPPIYDALGYQLDYEAIRGSSGPIRRHRSVKKEMARYDEDEKIRKRKAELLGIDPDGPGGHNTFAWTDRIARDLNIPYHTVELRHFEEWHEKGFRVEPGEFDHDKTSKEERDRLFVLATGSAFRKKGDDVKVSKEELALRPS